MSWSRATAAVLFVLTGCSLVVGELPDPLPTDAGAGQSGGSTGAMNNAGSSSAGHVGTSAAGSPDLPDAGPSSAGSDGSDAAQAGGGGFDAGFDACDRDGDGERSEDCGGDDCNDDDRNVFSTQDRYFDQPRAIIGGFDYNCDGGIEIEYPQPLSCSIDACELETQGFLDAPLRPCGELGDWGKCVPDSITGLMCEAQMIEMRRVACR